jgi:hypothetical protein
MLTTIRIITRGKTRRRRFDRMVSQARRESKEEKDDVREARVMAQVVLVLSCIIRFLSDVRCFSNTCLTNAFTIHSLKNRQRMPFSVFIPLSLVVSTLIFQKWNVYAKKILKHKDIAPFQV